jgi:hypothetical protein
MLGEETDITSSDSRWDDTMLTVSANRCLRRLSIELPLSAKAEIDAVIDQEEYALPADFVSMQSIVYPANTVRSLKSAPFVGDSGRAHMAVRHGWYWMHGKVLHLGPVPGSNSGEEEHIVIYYYRSRVPLAIIAPAEDGASPSEDELTDENQEIDIEIGEANLIQEWIKADMMASVISPDALLARWKERGSRDDSPIIPATKQFYQMFEIALEVVKRQHRSPVMVLEPIVSRRRRYGRPR